MRKRFTRKECREHLDKFRLGCELIKVIRHFFPELMERLQGISDPRNQSYITYKQEVLLAARILSAILFIDSMRKTTEEFNSEIVIENLGYLCGEALEDAPYWETINNYLKRVNPEELQKVVCELTRRLISSKAFENAKIRGKYWHIIIDGTGIYSSRNELDGKCTFRIHNKGTETEYKEYSYYVVEAKVVLGNDIVVSIMTEFVENKGNEMNKQDCERKACQRLMERLKEMFPNLPICIGADSLYACAPFFAACERYHWHYIIRYKDGSIPTVYKDYEVRRALEDNQRKGTKGQTHQTEYQYDFVNGINYKGHKLNCLEYSETGIKYPFYFLTDLPISHKNILDTVYFGRRRWKIENQGFNAQKNHGFALGHLFSHNYQAMKNHYFLIQIAHMISQIMDAYKKIWKTVHISKEQKHRRILESWKTQRLSEWMPKEPLHYQILLE